ncbi:thrombospondin type 3 repeat-containing protein [Catellatospora tritici]|uniref:thrombospondin type 3 repeat-containing protein n=1 Tax=Catellatospora tritici TaxID=2851566 RepID=UPI001C2DE32A|nr:thrombospondin type 3 repeat-containing protein [Catellatospora tritici]MBV1856699.1 thrombospondin type 3 repeat-containing protein [Catellatospora tritici]
MAAGLAGVLAMGGAVRAQAAEEPRPKYQTLRLCDPTGCYVAWTVVDSDNDGVCDADEIQAGTDPADPRSRPGLDLIAELLLDRKLPSFEYGLASLIAFPAEIMELREKLGVDPLGAFPLHKRGDALTRLGISGELMAKMGISPDSGFSLGLDHPTPGASTFEPRIAGIGQSLLSAGDKNDHAARGGVIGSSTDPKTGDRTTYFNDGSRDLTMKIEQGYITGTINADGTSGNNTVKIADSWEEDGFLVVVTAETTTNPAGTVLTSTTTESLIYPEGQVTTETVKTENTLDADGNIIGVTKTVTNEYRSKNGEVTSTTTTTSCDASGSHCASKEHYIDPEYAYGNMVSQEYIDNVLRTRGAAVTVVEGWTAPVSDDGAGNPQDPGTIMLVDESYGEVFLLVEPRVVTAQPEVHPGLPNPRDGWNGPPPGGCEGLC